LRLATVIAAFVLLAAGCSGSDGDGATTTSIPLTTTTTQPAEMPQALADRLIIATADVPAGYTVAEDEDEDGTACDGVDDVSERFTPAARRSVDLDGAAHFFNAQAFVYTTEADAESAFAYGQELATLCDGKPSTSADGEAGELTFASIEAPVDGVDQADGYALTVRTPSIGVVVTQYFVRSGNVALVTAGTDASTALALLEVMVARLRGTEAPVVQAPLASPTLLPGLGAAGDGTGGALAAIVRSAIAEVTDFSEAAQGWIDQATDGDIDNLADEACSALAAVGEGGDINEVLTSLYFGRSAQEREALDPQSYGQIVGAALVVYCPEVFQTLGL
jgi:hypothetical protein